MSASAMHTRDGPRRVAKPVLSSQRRPAAGAGGVRVRVADFASECRSLAPLMGKERPWADRMRALQR
eukprot:gene32967-65013_t